MRITVIGAGYLGATHAICMARCGHEVLAVDTQQRRVDELEAGRLPFYEPGLGELLATEREAGRIHWTTDYQQAAEFARLHFITVGTPQVKGGFATDVSAVRDVVSDLVPRLSGRHLLVGKSTVPVGTASELQVLADLLVGDDAEVDVCWNPEFLREGRAVADTLHPDRIVVGSRTGSAAVEALREVYREQIAEGIPFLETDVATAELVKTAANAFLATKVSFINAVADVCEAGGANIAELTTALGLDPRIGSKFLHAGLGFGGGCLPKDLRGFMARANELGADHAARFMREVDSVNRNRRSRVVDDVAALVPDGLAGARVCVLGAAYKPNSDDVRDSPALAAAGALSLRGADVVVVDPRATANARRAFPTLAYPETLEEALGGADVVVLATEWREYQEIDPEWAGGLVRRRCVVDARGALPAADWLAAGWTLRAVGRGLVKAR
ncbi:UDP-glucose dehydrogenase family protein [Corynebacterium otitidis]|uniref:UDP-glucose 6-dehydrogenase n=1 Tax=Corynebacterium otitidis ATCC 51513 TaxID=883169 RepID=I7L9L4_9CORY|nr:UDP-glucose/GDP-mannose dehydrogenase family protein [Corynebacterium otitidis]EJZ81690.1 nucleotide sugar dehydrogenase [Corynebacterium otitidis ATCC 51513]CCI83877.1 UDP-glucose 6-dehydrogenase [Corynebacterium otitidis ATCC 51513]